MLLRYVLWQLATLNIIIILQHFCGSNTLRFDHKWPPVFFAYPIRYASASSHQLPSGTFGGKPLTSNLLHKWTATRQPKHGNYAAKGKRFSEEDVEAIFPHLIRPFSVPADNALYEAAPIHPAKAVPYLINKANDAKDGTDPPPTQSIQLSNLLFVEANTSNEDSIISLHPSTMKQLGILKGDTVILKGGKRKESCAIALQDNRVKPNCVAMPLVMQRNLRVGAGRTVRAVPSSSIAVAKSVYILPFEDTLNTLPKSTNIYKDLLLPYFHGNDRPLHSGDHFKVPYKNVNVEFKVLQITTRESDDAAFGLVGSSTVIDCDGDTLSRDEDDSIGDVGYDDIGGLGPQLLQIRETVDLPLRHPEVFEAVGIAAPKGVLLHGAPGCGKTMIARAIATETGAHFYSINGPEIMSKLAGESEQNIRRIFEKAMGNPPAVIFIDEIDSIASKREKAGGEVERRVVSQLLTLLDGLKPSQNVIVIAATNRPNVLDSALRRFGRFDRELEISVPDESGRYDILCKRTKGMHLSTKVDLKQIAKDSHGYVGADIAQLCFEAAMNCIRKHIGDVDFEADSIPPEVLAKFEVQPTDFEYALRICNPSALRERQVQVPKVTWSDVGGLEEVKKELVETVQYPVEYPEKFKKYGMAASKGVLFYGPPGCGKTLLAKAIANECNANFISVKGPELLTMWFGESEANVRELFDKARAAAPCILFFDEMDSIAKSRGTGVGGGGEAADRVINQILTEIDGLAERKPVFIIGASNRPDILDPAITRPGRLDQLLYIPLPDMKSRVNIFKAALRKSPLEPGLDIEYMAKQTNGFSGADITEICQRAAKQAIRENIEAEVKRGRPLKEGEADPVPYMTKAHFKNALKHARRSVSEDDIRRYEEFSKKLKTSSISAQASTPLHGKK